ncbi:MAG: DUF2279 domain-containing protein [Bacteroidetes bacterium]|nr:MAG: DUF2279 domain-containing protein [Bacteroidota bacterium]
MKHPLGSFPLIFACNRLNSLLKYCKGFALVSLLFISQFTFSQEKVENDSVNKKRLSTVIIASTGAYAVALGVLYYGWYAGQDPTSFHFINDSEYWLQVDKAGHATTSYTLTNYGFWTLRWSGVSNNKAAWYGGLMGFGAMTVIELLDGFAPTYGASWYDLTANALGTGIFISQQLLWKEQRIRMKFSYHPTDYAQYNPSQLGETTLQRMLKDYNGHTYWFSFNIHSFLKEESKFPAWINVAAGYGAEGMLAPITNPTKVDGEPVPQFDRVRQYYVSMDIDWTKIKTNSSFLRFVFKGLSFVKLPFPTLEYNNENHFVFHWMYL